MRPDLLWRSSLWLLLASCPALAAESGVQSAGALPREFWSYYAEFGDERGELLDPLDYSEASRLPHRDITDQQKRTDLQQQAPAQPSAPAQHEDENDESGS